MSAASATQTLELLAWIERHQPTYAETMDAWRSTCPRLSVWEDAGADGLVEVIRAEGGSVVRLTAAGRRAVRAVPADRSAPV
jgi:hypothetical protein